MAYKAKQMFINSSSQITVFFPHFLLVKKKLLELKKQLCMSEPQVQSDGNTLYTECSPWGFTKVGGISPSHIVPDSEANSEPSWSRR